MRERPVNSAQKIFCRVVNVLGTTTQQYVQLSEQIYPISLADRHPHPEFKWPSRQKGRQIRSQLRNLVREEIGAVLANTEARTNVLKKAVVALQGKSRLDDGGNLPFIGSFELNGIPTLAVGQRPRDFWL
jgi:hypothetical protein